MGSSCPSASPSLLGQQVNFLEDPLSVLGFLGIALIAMGFVADAAAYGEWANHDSARLPRVSRVLLYVGYVLVRGRARQLGAW